MGATNALPSPGDDEADVYVLRNGRYVPRTRVPRGFHRIQFFQDAPQLEKAATQAFPVRLHKSTLRLLPEGKLTAVISAAEPCTVVVRERVPLECVEDLPEPDPRARPVGQGCAQQWTSDVLSAPLSELAVVDAYAPFVVELRTESHVELTIARLPLGSQPKVLKQRVFVRGVGYDLQDIYGREETDDCAEVQCVICLLEPKDTAVLPCRHLCLCSGCAEVMRMQSRKCPICRQGIVSLLQIESGSESASPPGETLET